MPDIREALVSILGDLVDGRMYPNVLKQVSDPESDLPALVYQRISKSTVITHDDRPGLPRQVRPRFQLTCWGVTPGAAEELGNQVLDRIAGLKQTVDGVRIDAVLPQNDATDRDPVSQLHRRIVDVFIWHIE